MDELEAEIGAEDLSFILSVYLDEARAMLDRMGPALDARGHARAVHFLRSGALNMGLRGIAAAAEGAECGGPADRLGCTDCLRRALSATAEAIRDRQMA
ncbi:Hpt domain-containing protein [Jannaschia rubra]|uniref:Hpt domain-containing protein n=1 Tax=Jannaschia rubra TaxID=282197 RepID=UPI0024909AE5|nr:Hpt domain-containing protein [Jannaschia rubra]